MPGKERMNLARDFFFAAQRTSFENSEAFSHPTWEGLGWASGYLCLALHTGASCSPAFITAFLWQMSQACPDLQSENDGNN